MFRHTLAIAVLLTLSIGLPAQTTPSADVMFKTARQLEQVDGDLPGAMAAYQSIVDRFPQHPLAPQALAQMAGIQQQQGDAAGALERYRTILRLHPDSPAASVARIRVAAAGGSAAQLSRREITDIPRRLGEYGQVSPDGRWLSFSDIGLGESSGNLGIWRIGTGDITLLTHEPCCEWAAGYNVTSIWSRDGRRIAYLWLRDGVFELRVVAREGGASRTLIAITPETRGRLGLGERPGIWPLDWSPDGTWIFVVLGEWAGPGVVGRTRLARVALADGAVTTLAQLGERGMPARGHISPDGAFVVYDYLSGDGKSDTDVFIVSADGGAPRALVADPSSLDAVVGWMPPDGGHLLYTSSALGTNDLRALPMRAGESAGSSFLLQSNVGEFIGRGLTANGRFYAEHAQPRSDVFVADIDAATGRLAAVPRPLPRAQTGTRYQASWSPDGTRIAYFHPSPLDALTLAVQDVATNAVRSYPLPIRNAERPVWRPDGRAIAFNAVGDQDPQAVFLLELATGTVERVAPSQQVAFSPDGRYLYYPRRSTPRGTPQTEPPDLVRRRIADGSEDVPYRSFGLNIALAISPDGRTFAGFVDRGRNPGPGGLSVVTFPANGGSPNTVVAEFPNLANEVAWSPDGQFLYLATNPRTPDRADAAIWRVPAAGGTPQKVGALPWPAWAKHLSVAPNGRLAIRVVGADTELWSWDNLPALIRSRKGR